MAGFTDRNRPTLTVAKACQRAQRLWGRKGFAEKRGKTYFVGSGCQDMRYGESAVGFWEAFEDADQRAK